jgi:hypothetical protein
MSQRWIGQEAFAFGSSGVGRRSSLDHLRDLIVVWIEETTLTNGSHLEAARMPCTLPSITKD